MNNIHYIKRLIDNRIVSKLNISKSFLKDNSNIANNSIEYELWVKDSFKDVVELENEIKEMLSNKNYRIESFYKAKCENGVKIYILIKQFRKS